MSKEERDEKWRWAHGSEQAKTVRKMEGEFREELESLQKLPYEEKMVKKQELKRKVELDCLGKCKEHGGPITLNEVGKLDSMTYDQVLLEVKFLKKTNAPQLRIKRKIDRKFVNYTKDQLVQQIKDVLKPSDEYLSVENKNKTTPQLISQLTLMTQLRKIRH